MIRSYAPDAIAEIVQRPLRLRQFASTRLKGPSGEWQQWAVIR